MESAAKIKEILQAASMEKLPEFIAEYENDPRSGVQKLVSSAKKKIDALEKERQRIENLKKYEKEYAQYTYICGIDEVGHFLNAVYYKIKFYNHVVETARSVY